MPQSTEGAKIAARTTGVRLSLQPSHLGSPHLGEPPHCLEQPVPAPCAPGAGAEGRQPRLYSICPSAGRSQP